MGNLAREAYERSKTIHVGLAEVWYKRQPTFRSDPDLRIDNLEATHVHVHNVQVNAEAGAWGDELGTVYHMMQGEVWSSSLQARQILRRRGVGHTSLSIGDVVIMPNDKVWECTEGGWRAVGWLEMAGIWKTRKTAE